MRKNKKQLILKLLNEKIMPSYADKLAYFFPLSSLLLDYRKTFYWTTEGLSVGLQKDFGGFYPNSGRVLPQPKVCF